MADPALEPDEADERGSNFVRELVAQDLAQGKNGGRLVTRFPPEPNGYLHVGHAKSICLNFGLAEELGGIYNLRFDDTNPEAESTEYVEAIKRDVRWLGFDWKDRLYFASDYFEQLYAWAVKLIEAGKAYVDTRSLDEIREGRGNYYKPGVDSPHRNRSVEENLALFGAMRAGEIDEGAAVLRAKIDMQSSNLNMRDPLMYRVRKVTHHRTGDNWCIYPMYDYAHGQGDAIEGVTHSVCTLEFQDHRPLYDWFLENLPVPHRPRQIEFGRLNLSYVVLSKRKLLELVEEGHVDGWDDPRMPTISGMRRRGYPAEALRGFCDRIGVSKRDGVVDVSLLEHEVREHLDKTTPRVMSVLDPLKLVIENFPEDHTEWFDAPLHPSDASFGTRRLPLTKEVWIERGDFREEAPRKWYRFAPGKEVRLRYACLVTVVGYEKNEAGEVTLLRCTWDPDSKGGAAPDGRKVKGTSHWVSASHATSAVARIYDRLFSVPNPGAEGDDWKADLNPDSREVTAGVMIEPHLAEHAEPGSRWQFERLGYFCVDTDSVSPGSIQFNRTIALRDSWAKLEKKMLANKTA